MKNLKYPLNIQTFGEEVTPETLGDNTDSSGAEEPKVLTQQDIDRAVSIAVNKRDEKHAKELSKAVKEAVKEQQMIAALKIIVDEPAKELTALPVKKIS